MKRVYSLKEISLELNRNPQFLNTIKHTNREKWEKMTSFDQDLRKSILLYISYVENLKSKLQDLYYDPKAYEIMLSHYGDTHPWQRDVSLSDPLFNAIDGLTTSFRFVLKMEKMMEKINEQTRTVA